MTKPLFIGVTGTHSTGKSTFIGLLQKALIGGNFRVSKIGDLATEAKNRGFPILHQHTENSTLWLATYGIAMELEEELGNDVIIVDRPIIDAIGYYRAAMSINNKKINTKFLDQLLSMASEWLERYCIIFKTVLNPEIPLGPGRNKDIVFRELADTMIIKTINDLGIEYSELTENRHSNSVEHVIRLTEQVDFSKE